MQRQRARVGGGCFATLDKNNVTNGSSRQTRRNAIRLDSTSDSLFAASATASRSSPSTASSLAAAAPRRPGEPQRRRGGVSGRALSKARSEGVATELAGRIIRAKRISRSRLACCVPRQAKPKVLREQELVKNFLHQLTHCSGGISSITSETLIYLIPPKILLLNLLKRSI